MVEDERDAPSGEMPASRAHMTFLSEYLEVQDFFLHSKEHVLNALL